MAPQGFVADRPTPRPSTLVLLAAVLLLAGCARADRPVLLGPTTTQPPEMQPPDVQPTAAEPTGAAMAAAPGAVGDAVSAALLRRAPIVLGFGGDTAFTDGLADRDPFGAVGALLQSPDLMVVNLETAVADVGVGRPPVDKKFLFRSPPASLDLLIEAGIDVVGLANNHTLDYGPDAVAQTLAELDRRGIPHVGAGLDEMAAYRPLVIDVGAWRVGLVSLSRVPCDWSAGGENLRPEVAWACPSFVDRYEAMVNDARTASDVVVVMIHGGDEGVLCPSPFMIDLEKRMAELGVDVVINGHPHVVQGVTSWPKAGGGDTLVVHSSGNFAFPSANGITANSAVFLVEVSEDGVTLRVEPVRAAGGVLTMPTEQQRAGIVDQINRVSDGWQLDTAGRMTPAPTAIAAC